MSVQVKRIDDAPQRSLTLRERYLATQEALVRERAKQDKITGSVTLEYAQGTVVSVTVNRKVADSV